MRCWKISRCIFLFPKISSIHGFNHLTTKKITIWEWLVWVVLISLAIAGAVMLSLSNWNRYQDNPTVISVEHDYKEWNTSFPSITICPTAHGSEGSSEFLEQLNFLPPEQNNQNLYNFTYILNLEDRFVKTLTETGLCYTYGNNVASYFAEKNWCRQRSSVMHNQNPLFCSPLNPAFSFQVMDVSSSAKVYIDDTSEIPDSSTRWLNLLYKHHLTLKISVGLNVFSTAEVRSLSISQRKCHFLEESDLAVSPVYSYNLCRMQCRMELALKLCGCVPHVYRVHDGHPVCQLGSVECLRKHAMTLVTLRNGKERLCECRPTCDQISYFIEEEKQIVWEPGTTLHATLKYPRLRFKRDVLYGFTDFLVSVGATGGLFLGCSILSLVEMVYFLTLRAFCFYCIK